MCIRDRIADTVSFKGFAPDSTEQFPYSFVVADVVNNSVTHLSNYITVDKGKLDGIMPDMGVVSERGVVGIVSTVSDHFSVIIPLLNPKFRLSCKVLGSSYFGSLSWNGPVSYTHLPSFFNLFFNTLQYFRGLGLSVKIDITSTIEKYHSSCSSSHMARTFLSSNKRIDSFCVICSCFE